MPETIAGWVTVYAVMGLVYLLSRFSTMVRAWRIVRDEFVSTGPVRRAIIFLAVMACIVVVWGIIASSRAWKNNPDPGYVGMVCVAGVIFASHAVAGTYGTWGTVAAGSAGIAGIIYSVYWIDRLVHAAVAERAAKKSNLKPGQLIEDDIHVD